MKKTLLKIAVSSTLGFVSTQVFAAGTLCALPAAPVSSAYINAYNAGRVIPPLAGPATSVLNARMNFGTTSDGGSAGSCEITGLANDNVAPATGYGALPVASATRTIPSVTGGATSIGQVVERIWRKPAATAPVTPTDMCIFGTKISVLSNTDHDSVAPGVNYFELSDLAHGGFSASGTVNVGYFKQAANTSRLYRVGRTFTSVQHRAYRHGKNAFGSLPPLAELQNNATGYLDLPPIAGLPTTTINGNLTTVIPGGIAPAAITGTQQAQVNSNWVDFTTNAYFIKYGGTTAPVSIMTYIEAPCNSDSAATINSSWVKPGAIRLRQTLQNYATYLDSVSGLLLPGTSTLKEIAIDGYAPPGAVIP